MSLIRRIGDLDWGFVCGAVCMAGANLLMLTFGLWMFG